MHVALLVHRKNLTYNLKPIKYVIRKFVPVSPRLSLV